MKYTIDEEILSKQNIDFDEFVLLIYLVFVSNNKKNKMESLKDKGFIMINKKNGFVTEAGMDIIRGILLGKEITVKPNEDRCLALAKKINEEFPKSKMPGGPYYFRCNDRDLAKKLETFFERYGNYSDDDIVAATRKYVAMKSEDLTKMRMAKYFVWKDERKLDENGNLVTESTSDLANMLKNLDSGDDFGLEIDELR